MHLRVDHAHCKTHFDPLPAVLYQQNMDAFDTTVTLISLEPTLLEKPTPVDSASESEYLDIPVDSERDNNSTFHSFCVVA
ncbi:hypothetical protein H0H81_011691 [Sphagnurus paluster]|uniref:Uncharacterized protein n=1 Tax=Sphagnurus paluster TaxID=117069 RepID=A0A9P7GJT4_9AGAR|nr:hypothetical protein H0H81_011691 [Sphagnurus paluster]